MPGKIKAYGIKFMRKPVHGRPRISAWQHHAFGNFRFAEKVFLLADSSKIGTPSFVVSGTTSDIDVLITDSGIPAEAIRALKKKKVEIVV